MFALMTAEIEQYLHKTYKIREIQNDPNTTLATIISITLQLCAFNTFPSHTIYHQQKILKL